MRFLVLIGYYIELCRNVSSVVVPLTDLLRDKVTFVLVSHSQTFRLTAEGLKYMAALIGQGPPMRLFDRHVKQPITVRFIQRHVSGHGNVSPITDQCVKLTDVF